MKHASFTLAAALTLAAAIPALAHAQTAQCPLLPNPERVAPTATKPGACVYMVSLPHFNYTRTFKLLVPDSYRPGAAHDRLVVDYHGYGNNKSNQMEGSCWKGKALAAGFVVAYPHGTGFPTSFSAGDYCCDTGLFPQRDDVAFAKSVVGKVKALLHPASPYWRVYASGLSNGAAVAHNLACEATDTFDGIAAVSQTFAKKPGRACLNGRPPVPVIDFRAKCDTVIPYCGGTSAATLWGEDYLSAAESRAEWAEELHCSTAAPLTKAYGGSSSCDRLHSCDADYVQCTIWQSPCTTRGNTICAIDTEPPVAPLGDHSLYKTAAAHGIDVCEAAWEMFGEQVSNLLP